MRKHRVRFTAPKVRCMQRRVMAVRTRDGISRYANNVTGRALKRERAMEQRERQDKRCCFCEDWLPVDDCVFVNERFDRAAVNPVTHRKCRKENRGE